LPGTKYYKPVFKTIFRKQRGRRVVKKPEKKGVDERAG